MAESATIIILPVIRAERFRAAAGELVHRAGVDLAHQEIAPSADRRKVIELRRVRELREFQHRFANYKAEIDNKP